MKKEKLIKSDRFLPMIFLLLAIISFSKCTTIHCPAFSEEYKAWMPYYLNQELCFTSEGDTIRLEVEEYNAPEEHSYQSNCDCDCETSLYFITSSDETSDVRFEGSVDQGTVDENNIPSFVIRVRGDTFYFGMDEKYGNYNDSLQIGGFFYKDVVSLERWSGNNVYNKLVVVKNYGIVQFAETNGREWLLEIEE